MSGHRVVVVCWGDVPSPVSPSPLYAHACPTLTVRVLAASLILLQSEYPTPIIPPSASSNDHDYLVSHHDSQTQTQMIHSPSAGTPRPSTGLGVTDASSQLVRADDGSDRAHEDPKNRDDDSEAVGELAIDDASDRAGRCHTRDVPALSSVCRRYAPRWEDGGGGIGSCAWRWPSEGRWASERCGRTEREGIDDGGGAGARG